MLEPCILCGAPYNSLQPDFQTGFPRSRYEAWFLFACNALVFTLHLQLDQCSPIFRRTWMAEPEPLRGGVVLNLQLWCERCSNFSCFDDR